MGLYYRDSTGSDLCIAGNFDPSSVQGFTEVVADETSIKASTSSTLTLTPGDNVTMSVSGSEITIASTGGTNEVVDETEPMDQDEGSHWLEPYT